MKKETEVIPQGKDEAWCEWYECKACENNMITASSNYCPGCGRKIKWDPDVKGE